MGKFWSGLITASYRKEKNAPLQKGLLLMNSMAPALLSTHSNFCFTTPLHINIYICTIDHNGLFAL